MLVVLFGIVGHLRIINMLHILLNVAQIAHTVADLLGYVHLF